MSHSPDPSDFSRIRHDLRTPVNHIIGYAELLLEDNGLPTEFRDDLQRIHTGGRALLGLVKDYFDDEHFAQKRPDTHRMYHELRTPVNHIVGYTELLTELAEDHGLTHLHADFAKIGEAANTWLTLMEEYLLAPPGAHIETHSVVPPPGIRYVVTRDDASDTSVLKGRLLVVDDDPSNRDMLSRRLTRMGHTVDTATSGAGALQKLRAGQFDTVLLDLVMPGLDGYQVLTRIRSEAGLADVRVIMLSALDQEQNVARCIEAGADDFIAKPFNSVILRARLASSLEKKFLRDRERQFLAEIQSEREKSERLLLNVLPQSIAARLKGGETMIADHFENATVLFADLVGFTPLSRSLQALALVELLNTIFTRFDALAAELGLEKIKTIGDAYMVVAGVPTPRDDHVRTAAILAIQMRRALQDIATEEGISLNLRVGMHSGPVIAGIIGRNKFTYDLWGDTVNIASRMESSSLSGEIHLSATVAAQLGHGFTLKSRGSVPIKGIGNMETYFLEDAPGV